MVGVRNTAAATLNYTVIIVIRVNAAVQQCCGELAVSHECARGQRLGALLQCGRHAVLEFAHKCEQLACVERFVGLSADAPGWASSH